MSNEKYTVITGASFGIGRELSHVFAKNGHNLILIARSRDVMTKLKSDLELAFGNKIQVITCDLSDKEDLEVVVEKLSKYDIDILVNNAGIGSYGEFIDCAIERLYNEVNLNMVAPMFLMHEIANQMKLKKIKGKILNIASIASFMPGPLMAHYYATKAYLLSLGQSLNAEYKRYDISVTTFCPGVTKTDFLINANLASNKVKYDIFTREPLKVAQCAYKSLMKRKLVVQDGFINKVMVLFMRLIPRRLSTGIMYNAQNKRRGGKNDR